MNRKTPSDEGLPGFVAYTFIFYILLSPQGDANPPGSMAWEEKELQSALMLFSQGETTMGKLACHIGANKASLWPF